MSQILILLTILHNKKPKCGNYVRANRTHSRNEPINLSSVKIITKLNL